MLGALPVGLRFEEAVRITDAGLSSQRQLAGLWRRRQVIELDYARSLARLSVTGKAALQNINSSSRPSSPSTLTASTSTSPPTPLLQQLHSKDGGGSGPADGGVRQALEAAVDSMQAEAKSHENVIYLKYFAKRKRFQNRTIFKNGTPTPHLHSYYFSGLFFWWSLLLYGPSTSTAALHAECSVWNKAVV